MSSQPVRDFVLADKPNSVPLRTAVSLFSGAGLSDLGYEMAGFQFVVQVDVDQRRVAIGADNFPKSTWFTRDVRGCEEEIAEAYRGSTSQRLDLLAATPPCQGMSSSNPTRGKRQTAQAEALEWKNGLVLNLVPAALSLKPRIIVVENVRQVLTLTVSHNGTTGQIVDLLQERLPEYELFSTVVNAADYGIPQIRRRALVVGIHRDEPWLEGLLSSDNVPWPKASHGETSASNVEPWICLRWWLETMKYEPLDAKAKETARGTHPLHFVPAYAANRYRQISEIPAYSGRSAYDNDKCPSCGTQPVQKAKSHCAVCGSVMFNRPFVYRNGEANLIKGFKSSYRRMDPNRPSYTITTNSSHVGSDFKIHPWENRVLSALECADLQTVPRFYDWSRAYKNRTLYLIRNLVGEAFPPFLTYLHGKFLSQLLAGSYCQTSHLPPP